jgi:branched-chain amino acid transport system permease protein
MELLPQYILNGLMVGSTYAGLAVGFALTFSVLRVINMSHPDVFMVAMFVGLGVVLYFTSNLIIVLLFAALMAGALGLTVERFVLRPLRGAHLLMPMLASVGVSLIIQNGIEGLVGPDPLSFPRLVPFATISLGSVSISSLQMVNAGLAVLVLVGASIYVRGTRWGLAARAVAERSDVAATFGVNVTRVAQLTIGLSSIMAGIAGIGIAALYGSAWAFVGVLYALKSFICMLVAGNRHIEAVMAVGLLLGVVEALTVAYVSSTYRDVVAFVILIVVLYFRPNGLFGSYGQ